MTRIDAGWRRSGDAQAVLAALGEGGHEAWFVGGCVRDDLLGRPVFDVDMATTAHPGDIQRLAEAAGLRAIPTGFEHGTITVVAGGTAYEVTTLRRDVETNGRHAVVAFSESLVEDARRRDFTINALYCDPRGEVIDPLGGGLEDLGAGRIRFIDDPVARIREDYLRILRFFRFSATHGDPAGGMDPDALAAIGALAEGVSALAKERIGHEVMRLLAAPDPAPAVATMRQLGVLARVLPGSDPRALGPLVHLEKDTGTPADPVVRLAALGGDGPAEALRLSRAQSRRLEKLRAAATGGQGPGALGYRIGAEDAMSALVLRWALMETASDPDARAAAEHGAAQRFPVGSADLMPRYEGAALGAKLSELEARWIDSGFALDRDALLADD